MLTTRDTARVPRQARPWLVALVAASFSSQLLAADKPGAGHRSKDVVLATSVPEAAPDKPSASMPAADAVLDARQMALSGSLGDLGLHLLRSAGARAGSANANLVASPYGLANALGMMQAGAAGVTAREIGGILVPATAATRGVAPALRSLNHALAKKQPGSELVSANRVWLDAATASQIEKPFVATVADAYGGDGVMVNLTDAKQAAGQINAWVATATAGRITSLIEPSALPANTKAIVTNAVHFKAAWLQPFNPTATRPAAFQLRPGQSVEVATMTGSVRVREGTVNGLNVVELPYANPDFALVIALPVRPEHTLDALEQDTAGTDIVQWLSALRPALVTLQLPKFRIAPAGQPLKEALQAVGMRAAFAAGADFTPLAGKSALVLDNVIHAAGIVVDEQGTEAAAATAAVIRSKGMPHEAPLRKIDRPFLFAIVHKPTAAPLFVGRVYRPEF